MAQARGWQSTLERWLPRRWLPRRLSPNAAAGYFNVGSLVAGYDAQRANRGLPVLGVACYEGGWTMGPASVGDLVHPAGIIANLRTLGDADGYTSSLPGTASGPRSMPNTDAVCLLTLLNGFKNDNRAKALCVRYFEEFTAAATSEGARTALPAWYGFDGENCFSLASGLVPYSQHYKAYDALTEWNANE